MRRRICYQCIGCGETSAIRCRNGQAVAYDGRRCNIFFFNGTATPEIYTLSLHDALPIFRQVLSQAETALALARDGVAAARLAESHARRDHEDALRRQAENQDRALRLAALRDDLRTWTADRKSVV